MRRIRGLALVVAVAVAAGSLLAGCRANPGVAVYLGDRKISVDEVDAVTRSAPEATPNEVVSLYVCGYVGRQMVAERKLEPAPPNTATFAVQFGLPESNTYVRLWAECFALVKAAVNLESARPLSGDEAARLVAAYKAAGHDLTVEQAKRMLEFGPIFEAQRHYADTLARSRVTVNPRYGEPVMPVFEIIRLDIALPSGDNGQTSAKGD